MASLLANLRLRTKFLLSMVLVIAGLTGLTLLAVRHTVQQRARQELTTSAQNSLAMFQILQQQRRALMSRKADLLATSAFLSDDDASSFTDSTNNPLDTSRSDLMALADSSGKIISLHATHSDLSSQVVEVLLRGSISKNHISDWWFAQGRLYQVELHTIKPLAQSDVPVQSSTVIVGQEFDERNVRDLGKVLSSDVALRYDGHIVASTLDPYRESLLAAKVSHGQPPQEFALGDEKFIASSVNLTPDQPNGAGLIVFRSDADTAAFLQHLNRLLLQVGFLAVLAGAVVAFLISRTFTRPLESLVDGVRALEHGDYDYQLQVQGGGEVARVTGAFDTMRHTLQRNETERRQLEDQLRQSQKMEALGRLAGGVAHDFNNLLTIIKGHSELLLDRLSPADSSRKSSEQIHKAADRASTLTRQLLIFSRRQILQPKVLDLNVLISDMDKLLQRLIREDVEFAFVPGNDLKPVKADPGQIEQVLMNLTVNACDAMPHGGSLSIATQNLLVDPVYAQSRPGLVAGNYVLLSAADTGHGMDAKTQARIFEPFFTTKEVGKGTGLGLSTVYGIVKQSGGFIYVQSTAGKGTCFEIYLPQVDAKCEEPAPQTLAIPATPKALTVLVVEDDAAVRDLACRFLETAGFRVLAARDGVEALHIAGEHGSSIGALLTDVVMPRMRGTELAARLLELFPNLKVIFMSGYLDQIEPNPDSASNQYFIEKPFTRESILSKVNEAFRPANPLTNLPGRDRRPANTLRAPQSY